MRTAWIMVLAISALYVNGLTCPKYTVLEGESGEGGMCAHMGINALELKKCERDMVCEGFKLDEDSVCRNKTEKPNGSALAGEKCDKPENCTSGNCDGGHCKGRDENAACTKTEECHLESYCFKGVCKKAGDKCDVEGLGCATSRFRYIDLENATCMCLKYGQVDNDKDTVAPAACKSYYMNAEKKCAERPKITEAEDKSCKMNDKAIPPVCKKDNSTAPACLKGFDDIGYLSDVMVFLNI